MWNASQQARLDQLGAELKNLMAKHRDKSMSNADWQRLETINSEAEKLITARDTYQK